MGTYSELNIDLHGSDNPFEEGDVSDCQEAQSTSAAEEVSTAPDTGTVATPPQHTASTPSAATQETTSAPTETPRDTGSGSGDLENENAKRRAHEEAEAKRKAEFDARQAEKAAAEQEQLNRLDAMSDDEVLAASMKRVSADTEKLTRRNMKECVAEYIQTMCIEDPAFARKVMHPRKSMIHCFQYINRKAYDYIQDELKASGIQPGPGRQMYGCDVPDDLCYQWGVDYFNDPDAKEDQEDEEKFIPRSYSGKSTSTGKKGKPVKGKVGEKKADASPKAAVKDPPKGPAAPTGQISLGDLMMPEEKAG